MISSNVVFFKEPTLTTLSSNVMFLSEYASLVAPTKFSSDNLTTSANDSVKATNLFVVVNFTYLFKSSTKEKSSSK